MLLGNNNNVAMVIGNVVLYFCNNCTYVVWYLHQVCLAILKFRKGCYGSIVSPFKFIHLNKVDWSGIFYQKYYQRKVKKPVFCLWLFINIMQYFLHTSIRYKHGHSALEIRASPIVLAKLPMCWGIGTSRNHWHYNFRIIIVFSYAYILDFLTL